MTIQEVEQLKEGDLITAYRSGYHKFVGLKPCYVTERSLKYGDFYLKSLEEMIGRKPEVGDVYQYIIQYQQIADKHGTLVNGKRQWECSSSWCKKLTPEDIDKSVSVLQEEIDRLNNIKQLL